MSGLRIGLVSAYPPSEGPLAEYGWHLAEALCTTDGVERVHVLADRAPGAVRYVEGRRDVIPCWTFGSPWLGPSVIAAARHLPIDILWFNIHMTSTGNNRRSWFGGICAPALARAAGHKVLVTLHNMLGLTDLGSSGVRARPWDLAGAHVATRSLGFANLVAVLRPEYLDLLKQSYGIRNVVHLPHGTLGEPVAAPQPNDGTHIVTFGHFGTYKRLETLIEAVRRLRESGVPARLSIGGSDSRHAPGYLARMRERYGSRREVTFLGYVPEADVPALFQSATVCVLPYATMTGMSGVAIQAAMHGAPIVASDIAAFRALEREGLRPRFFEWGDAASLTDALGALLRDPEARRSQIDANLAFVSSQRMSMVARGYVGLMEALRRSDPLRVIGDMARAGDAGLWTGGLSAGGTSRGALATSRPVPPASRHD